MHVVDLSTALRLAAGMVEPALRADQLALTALKHGPAIHTVLLIVMRIDFALVVGNFLALTIAATLFFHSLSSVLCGRFLKSGLFYHASRKRAIPTALTAPIILNGSRSVVRSGTSSDE